MMKRSYLYLFSLLLATPAFAAWEDTNSLQQEVNRIKEDIVVIQRQLYRDKNNNTVAPQESVSNVQVRLGEYDQMIRDMNGKVENIEYRLSALEKKMEMIDKDIELRFSQFQRQNGSATSVANSSPAKTPAPLPKAPDGVSAKDLYEQALNDLKEGKLSDSELKFSQFLGSYPKDDLSGNAQYWLGEIYYKQQNFAKAAVAFKDGYSKYPEGSKGPDCLLKLGLSMKALNKTQEACTAFTNIPTIFGKVNPEISRRATEEAKGLNCK